MKFKGKLPSITGGSENKHQLPRIGSLSPGADGADGASGTGSIIARILGIGTEEVFTNSDLHTEYTALDLSSYIPATATHALLYVRIYATIDNDGNAYYRMYFTRNDDEYSPSFQMADHITGVGGDRLHASGLILVGVQNQACLIWATQLNTRNYQTYITVVGYQLPIP